MWSWKIQYYLKYKDDKIYIFVREIDDYRYDNTKEIIDEYRTIIKENDENKCAYSENGMRMHFLVEKELKELFSRFKGEKMII